MNLFTTQDGVALNYDTSGEGHAIVMIHTALENFTVFKELEKQLSRDYQIVLIDLRGHGYSDKPKHISFSDYGSDIKQLLDALYIKSCALIGHEMGASVSAELASKYPELVTSVTMVNPTMLEDKSPSERLYQKYAETIRNWDEEKQHKFLANQLYYDKKKAQKVLKQMENTLAFTTTAERQSVEASFNFNNIRNFLAQVQVPVQIIVGQHGERTTVVEAKEVADYITNSEFEVFQHSGLYPFIEEKEAFLKTVKPLINRFV
ncbi:alpha/beta fold hydrolase [Staphylococcus arlettae]